MFNLNLWKDQIRKKLPNWKQRFDQVGTNSIYYFLASLSLLPIVQAVNNGDWSGLAVMGAALGGAVSTNLLANVVQKSKDKSDAQIAEILANEVSSMPELKAELDALLGKMNVLQEAGTALATADQTWFQENIKKELKELQSSITYFATQTGNGAIAQGEHAVAVGAGGVNINGSVSGDLNVGDKNRTIKAETYIEHQTINQAPRNSKGQKQREALEVYLDNFIRVCSALPLAALGDDENTESNITLEKIYIDLNAARENKSVEKNEIVAPVPPPALQIAREENRLVLLGDPGAGKSTFVRHLLIRQAKVVLDKDTPMEGFNASLIPVMVNLRDLAPNLARMKNLESYSFAKQEEALAQTVWKQIETDIGAKFALLKDILQRGECFLALDGLDEVPHDLRPRLRQAIDALDTLHHIQRIIVTCRVRSYVGDAVLPQFAICVLLPFNEKQIRNFVVGWYNIQGTLGHMTKKRAKERADDLSRVACEADLRELSSNPMLLTTMAVIHHREVSLPGERVRIYNQAVELLLRRWQKHQSGNFSLPEILKDDLKLRAILETLAYAAHCASVKNDPNGGLLRKDALELLEKSEYLYHDLNLARDLLDYFDQRSGLLTGHAGDRNNPAFYSFSHRTFQEYLAGAYLAGQRDLVRGFLAYSVEGDSWDLCTQLAFEELYYNRRAINELLDLAYGLLGVPLSQGRQAERAVLWAGRIVTLLGREKIENDSIGGGNYLENHLLPGLVNLLSGSLSAMERVEAGDILGRLGDPRFDSQHWFLPKDEIFGFVHIPSGNFSMGAEDISPDEKPAHQAELTYDYWIAKFPVTVAQFRFFAEIMEINDLDPEALSNPDTRPICCITWKQALGYCRWLDEKLRSFAQNWVLKTGSDSVSGFWQELAQGKLQVLLPSEAEWEKAARGTERWRYPWGDEIDPTRANYSAANVRSTSAVGCFPNGASPYGILDLSGNTWEWTRSAWNAQRFCYPYNRADGREDLDKEYMRILRGGAFDLGPLVARSAYRYSISTDTEKNIGFRIALVPNWAKR